MATPDTTSDVKSVMQTLNKSLEREFWQEYLPVEELLCKRAQKLDEIIISLWHAVEWPEAAQLNIALFAVGGYGRGELHPHSDIDLLLLVVDQPELYATQIETFIQQLWDLKINIGHSVRNLEELREASFGDISIATSLLERRQLCGPIKLDRRIGDLFASDEIWPAAKFFRAKLNEQKKRHERHADTEYNLEPNIKSSPGGLRDIQTISWIMKRFFGSATPTDLVSRNMLTKRESQALKQGSRFLWKIRYGLHLLAGRGEDRLLFDYQRTLAEKFAYTDTAGQLAVEQFMHDYYRVVLELREINDLLLQNFDEAILRAHYTPEIEPINEFFEIRDNYIQVTSDKVFEKHPAALIEIFVVMAHRLDISGVRASTIRLIKNSLYLIDDSFREDPKINALFISLLKAPYTLVSQLTRMRRYGILGRYIKEFGKIVGQMQHDLFHIYTVDAHTMMVIRNMRIFKYRASQEKFPVACHCMKNIAKVELLYIAGLFHDIGKGRGGDHSVLGAVDAVNFCRRHSLSDDDTELVEWLVKSHLLMSSTAQRKDIHDPEVIHTFAQIVKTETRLDYLYVLTVADINATNPTLWNAWRATLLRLLYMETRKSLRRGLEDSVNRDEYIENIIAESLDRLSKRGVDETRARSVWESPDDHFFLQHSPVQVALITEAILKQKEQSPHRPVVLVRDVAGQVSEEGATEIFLYTQDQPQLFALTALAMDSLDLSIFAAHLHTSESNMCFNSYIVLDEFGKPLGGNSPRRQRVRDVLSTYITNPNSISEMLANRTKRLIPRRLKQFDVPTKAELHKDGAGDLSVLYITSADRPGLLAHIGVLFLELGIEVHSAKITTLGEKVEDVFYITCTDVSSKTSSGISSCESEAEFLTSVIRTRLDEYLKLA